MGEAGFGADGGAAQAHARFGGGAAGFAVVAGAAGGDEVFPGVAAAARAGDDVVEGEVGFAQAAVLAGVAVAGEDFAAGEAHHGPGAADEVDHADHAGDGEVGGHAAQEGGGAVERVDDFGFAACDEHDGAAHVADMQRLVVLVEHQHGLVEQGHPRISPQCGAAVTRTQATLDRGKLTKRQGERRQRRQPSEADCVARAANAVEEFADRDVECFGQQGADDGDVVH